MLTAQTDQSANSGQAPSVTEPVVAQSIDPQQPDFLTADSVTDDKKPNKTNSIDADLQATIDNLAGSIGTSPVNVPSNNSGVSDQPQASPTETNNASTVAVPPTTPVTTNPPPTTEKAPITANPNPAPNIAENIPQLTPVRADAEAVKQPPATAPSEIGAQDQENKATTASSSDHQEIPDPIKTGETVPLPGSKPPVGAMAANDQSAFTPTNTFFDILVKNGQITQEQAANLRQTNLSSGKSYEDLLLEHKLASEKIIVQAKAEFNHLPYIDLSSTGINPEALTLLDEGIAKRYQALPFSLDKEQKSLKVAMANPLDLAAIDFLQQKTGYHIEAYYSEASELGRTITERYAQSLSTEVTEALKTTDQYQNRASSGVELNRQSDEVLRDAPINRIVENILDFAIKSRASDVHIEPQTNRTRVRYRIDGLLQEKLILPRNVHDAVVSRIKIMANLKIDEKRLPQDGRFNYQDGGVEIDLRISTLPTVHGEKVVMRLLQKNLAVPSLEDLGLNGLGLQRVKEAIKVPHGIVLITGPTGSGKTTTLYSILHMINKVGVNIMTLEDPVEYQIPGVSQVQVNPKAGLTFASGLRSFLRQDPDIIMVGEIRDNETADLALQASLTGHLVFSTLHTNSASGALPRLLDMQAESFLLASSMTLAMGQRVVRRINPAYKEEYKPEPVVIEDIKQVLGVHFDRWCKEKGKKPEEITLFRPKEDRPSSEPDYKGRVGIFEVMPISPEIASLIMNRAASSEIEKVAMQQGMTLMKQDGYFKALEGLTTIEEVLRVAEVA